MSFFTIGGTNFVFLAIGGTYVYLIEGGTNVGWTNVGRTNVGGRKVAASTNSFEGIFDVMRKFLCVCVVGGGGGGANFIFLMTKK
jgi:hypothetical protein